jgi:FtsH-binding integral membrane protein
MIAKLIIKAMFAIAGMSKKASAIYLAILTFFFLAALGFLLFGIILVDQPNGPSYGIPLTITGAILMFLVVATIAISTIASNYVRKNADKDPKKNTK